MASCAPASRRRPSKVKGRVTTPTVRLPASLEMRATTGAEPLPVPPPMPAVMKTRSAPFTADSMASRRLLGRRLAELGVAARAKSSG